MDWNFNAADYEERDYAPLPIGDYRVRIKEVESKTSSNGNPMIKLTLNVSGKNNLLWHNIVFMKDNAKMTNQMLGAFYESFAIPANEQKNEQAWVGKVGAARVKHEMYNDEPQAKVSYFLTRRKQESLPTWQESDGGNSSAPSSDFEEVPISNNDLPF